MSVESIEKVCFKCGKVKVISEFYKHSKMADGHLNKCKECTKKDVICHRGINIKKIRAYDRERGHLKSRITKNTERTIKYRKENPEKYKATMAVSNAKRSGKIVEQPCSVCGSTERLEAHHEDYSKPLEIKWLCSACHHAVHHKDFNTEAQPL